MANQPYIKSRPFDVHRWADYPELNNCLGSLADEIDAFKKRKRSRTADEAKNFRDALRILALNLYAAWKMNPKLQVGIDLNRNRYVQGRYKSLYLSYRPMKDAFDGLEALEYLIIDKRGFFDSKTGTGKSTRIRATEKLISLLTDKARLCAPRILRASDDETIILKDEKKHQIDYADTDQTRLMRENLTRINKVLLRSWPDLYIPDVEFERLQARLSADDEHEPIDFSSRTLVREFNNGSFNEGGRFYRGWWQNIPKEYRRFIKINDKATVELDYSGIHPTMLYAKVGKPMPKDPYDIGLDPQHRDLVKLTLNAIINAGPRGVDQPSDFDPKALGMTWAEFQDRIKKAHAPIASYFNSGIGIKLQYKDSCIAEKVLLGFASKGFPCLPIHDSFIMHHGYKDELDGAMSQAFKEITGINAKIKGKEIDFGVEVENKSASTDLDDIIQELSKYSKYNKRLSDFRGLI